MKTNKRIKELEDKVEKLEEMVKGLSLMLSIERSEGDLEILSIMAAELGYEEREQMCDAILAEINDIKSEVPKEVYKYFGRDKYKKVTLGSDFQFGGF